MLTTIEESLVQANIPLALRDRIIEEALSPPSDVVVLSEEMADFSAPECYLTAVNRRDARDVTKPAIVSVTQERGTQPPPILGARPGGPSEEEEEPLRRQQIPRTRAKMKGLLFSK